MRLVSKISNLCDPDPPTSQTDRRTDGRADGRHAISIPRYALVHRAVKSSGTLWHSGIVANDFHIVRSLLPPECTASQNCTLRPRVHRLQLPDRPDHLADSNFIVRMLFRNVYYSHYSIAYTLQYYTDTSDTVYQYYSVLHYRHLMSLTVST